MYCSEELYLRSKNMGCHNFTQNFNTNFQSKDYFM